jgi:hypothetical protein
VSPATQIEALNRDCYCISVDQEALRRELESDPSMRDLYRTLRETHPHLFARLPAFVSAEHVHAMGQLVSAVEAVVRLPAYRDAVLDWAPEIARFEPGPLGAFMGYDFHLSQAGPKLIEINTNAGGALLNAVLARAQRACCEPMQEMMVGPVAIEALEQTFFDMFASEWRRQRGEGALARVAIVDDTPERQYLYPEFLLFQQLFCRRGVDALISDPHALSLRDGALWHEDKRIDLIYNRLTDFSFEEPDHAALRTAYLDAAAVFTPHPRAHALYADKRNLTILTDAKKLRSWGVDDDTVATLLRAIPHTETVAAADAERLWAGRRKLFFKPVSGYGGKAAYRGDKLTRGVWEEILAGSYVAQEVVPPTERRVRVDHEDVFLKVDVRNYVYDGCIQLLAARLYQGQTTNFRTPGGGFATVLYPRQ